MRNLFRKLGVNIPEILLPVKGTDLRKWSVIACDQYTSQPEYWHNVNEEADGKPSTLNMTFPEIYLKDNDKEKRINIINETMQQYINQGILEPQTPGFILVDRSTPHAASRKGLIIAVDLECYDYRTGSQTLIRATEGTVLDRIPPRVKIRENAPIELPHIMLLIDDPAKTVIEKLYETTESYKKLYDFDLMQGGGHIKGWKVEDTESLLMIANALSKLADPSVFMGKYGQHKVVSSLSAHAEEPAPLSPLLFAAGDGNHSLATAKAHWENVKAQLLQQASFSKEVESGLLTSSKAQSITDSNRNITNPDQSISCPNKYIPDHPARYALVEVVNVHDEGLVFEPIHRVLFGIDKTVVLDSIKNMCAQGINTPCANAPDANTPCANTPCANAPDANAPYGIDCTLFESKASMEAAINNMTNAVSKKNNRIAHLLPFILEGVYGLITVQSPSYSLEVGTLQSIIDELMKNNEKIEVDYIHGEQIVTELGSKPGCMGFYLPVMSKHDLFKTVILDGVLPRKTFSMGEAEEKRYYLECRRIR